MSNSSEATANDDGTPLFMQIAETETPDLLIHPVDRFPMPPGLSQDMIDTMANQSKEEGDKLYRQKKYKEAHDAYKYGYIMPTSDSNVRKSIMLNMAATNLQLKDWFAVLRDTAWVLKMDPKSVKGLYRAARALIELTRFPDALDCCDRALKLEPHNKSLQDERRTALNGTLDLHQQAVGLAYRSNHLFIVPSIEDVIGTGRGTKPSTLPYLDPPLPQNPLLATLFCHLNIAYPERSACDMVADFPFDKPILPLLEILLPGPTGAQILSPMRENLVFIPNPHSHTPSQSSGFAHPTSWDPEHQFIPSTTAIYALTHKRAILPVTGLMTLADICAETKELTEPFVDDSGEYNSGEDHIEVIGGLILLYAFRKGSEAEERFEDADFGSMLDLANPEYNVTKEQALMTNLRYRSFNYGPPNRAVNDEKSLSFLARQRMLRQVCENQQEYMGHFNYV